MESHGPSGNLEPREPSCCGSCLLEPVGLRVKWEPGLEGAQRELTGGADRGLWNPSTGVSQGPEVTGTHREPPRPAAEVGLVLGLVSSRVHSEVGCSPDSPYRPREVSLSKLGFLGLGLG